jgi:hypothetical protein
MTHPVVSVVPWVFAFSTRAEQSIVVDLTECTGKILVSTSGEHDGETTGPRISFDANEGFVVALAANASPPSI